MAKERDIQFGVSYGYTGYPMIRQAREMIRNGAIGDIVHVRVQHPEDWVIESVSPEEDKNARLPWRFDPETVGSSLCTGDLGTHAEQLLVQFTGLHIKRVLAMLPHIRAICRLRQIRLFCSTSAMVCRESCGLLR